MHSVNHHDTGCCVARASRHAVTVPAGPRRSRKTGSAIPR
jgi:hypothetical protein